MATRPPVLFVSPVAWDGLPQRHQALAAGLARRGFAVTYLNPLQGGGFGLTAAQVAAGRLIHLQVKVPFRATGWPGLQTIAVRLAAGLLRRAGALTPHHLVWAGEPSLAGLFGAPPHAALTSHTFPSSSRSPALIHTATGEPSPLCPGAARHRAAGGGAPLVEAEVVPILSPPARRRDPRLVVYDRCDRHGAFPGQRAAVWQRYERWWFERADLVVATCPVLLPTPAETPARRLLLPNAARPRRDGRASGASRPAPPPWRLLSAGAHYEWTDLAWLERLAGLPQVELHLAGPGRGPFFARLRRSPTVHDHGLLPPAALEDLMATCHLGLIPFLDLPLTRAVDPLKAYEYKLYGLYVWATGPVGLREHPCVDLVSAPGADPAADWATILAHLARPATASDSASLPEAAGPQRSDGRNRRLRVPTWDDRLDRLVQELEVLGC